MTLPTVSAPIITVEGVMPEEDGSAPNPPPKPEILVEPVADEIVVTGENYGKARVEAETEFDEERIAAHGADSIQELLKKLAPWIDPTGEEAVILINGEPAGFDRSILGYPAEALKRLDVLKPEAASEYGQPAGKRVVNLVLKKQFSSINADIGGNWAIAGGQSGKHLSLNRSAISGRTRWTAMVRASDDSIFWKYRRNAQRKEGVFDGQGLILPLREEEIDPVLSGLAGRPIYYAALPEQPVGSLAEFLPFVGLRDEIDPARYESFSPARRTLSLNLGITRPLGAMSVSLSINGNMSDNEGYRGPAMAQMIWREGHPLSPFGQDVQIVRPLGGLYALRSSGSSQSLGGALNINGNIAGWQSNLALNYSRSWNRSVLDNGVDQLALQAALDQELISPFHLLGVEWLGISRNQGRQNSLSARLNMQRILFDLPAGGLSLTLGANASVSGNKNNSLTGRTGAGQETKTNSRREQVGGQFSMNIPLNRKKQGLIPLPIDVSLDLNSSVSQASDGRVQRNSGLGGSIAPWEWLQLRSAFNINHMAPESDQLDRILDEQIRRVFDYRRQEMVDVIWVTGGNPLLRRGRREGLNMSAMIRPFSHGGITLNIGYRRSAAINGISGLPELSPSVEQAFPDRISRDAEGRLVRVDARSINLESDSQSSLSNSLNLRWPMSNNVPQPEDAWQFQASISHQASLSAKRRIRDDLPIINLLAGETGQSRHSLSGQLTASRSGVGATVSGQWSTSGRLAGGEQGSLLFKPPLVLNLSTFIEPHRFWPALKDHKIWKGFRFSVDVQNVTRAYRRVLRADGTVPPGYGRDDVDPLGRTIRVQIRKGF